MLAAVRAYDVVVFVHVLAVVVAFGGMFAYPALGTLALKRGPGAMAYLLRAQEVAGRISAVAMLVLLGAGLYLVADGPFGFSDVWLSASFAILIVLWLMGALVFRSLQQRAVASVDRDATGAGGGTDGERFSQETHAALARLQRAGVVWLLLVTAAVFLMTVKP